MSGAAAVIALVLALAAAGLGVGVLRSAWTRRGGGTRVLAGWAILAVGAPAWRGTGAAWDQAVVFAALAGSIAALAWLTLSVEIGGGGRKPARNGGPDSVEPAAGPGSAWRYLLDFVLAGPAAGAAALGLAALTALKAPWVEADRLVGAGFVLPLAWAIGGIWATTDRRRARVAAGLVGIAAIAFGGAWC